MAPLILSLKALDMKGSLSWGSFLWFDPQILMRARERWGLGQAPILRISHDVMSNVFKEWLKNVSCHCPWSFRPGSVGIRAPSAPAQADRKHCASAVLEVSTVFEKLEGRR